MQLPEYLTIERLRALVNEFNLGHPLSVQQLPSDPASVACKLETKGGNWFIKKHHPERTPQQVTAEYNLLLNLRQAGFQHLPVWLTNAAGEPWLVLDSQLWSVQKLIIGDTSFQWTSRSWLPEHSQQAGLLLGQLHHAGTMALQQNRDLHNRLGGSRLQQLPQWWQAGLAAASSSAAGQSMLAHLGQTALEQLEKKLEKLLKETESAAEITPTIVHGDFHPGNILFAGFTPQAVIDFDFAHLEHPLYDLGYAAVMFAGMGQESPKALSREHLEALLSGYLSSPQTLVSRSDLASTTLSQPLSRHLQLACYLTMVWALDGYSNHSFDHLVCRQVIEQAVYLLR